MPRAKRVSSEPPQFIQLKSELTELRRHTLSAPESDPLVIAGDMHVALHALAMLADVHHNYPAVYLYSALAYVRKALIARVEQALGAGWHSPFESHYRTAMKDQNHERLHLLANTCLTLLPFALSLAPTNRKDPQQYFSALGEQCWAFGSARIQGHAQDIYNVALAACIEPDHPRDDEIAYASRARSLLPRYWAAVRRLAVHYSERKIGLCPDPLARFIPSLEARVSRAMSRLSDREPILLHWPDMRAMLAAMLEPQHCMLAKRWADWTFPIIGAIDAEMSAMHVHRPVRSVSLTRCEEVFFEALDIAVRDCMRFEEDGIPHLLEGNIRPLPWVADVNRRLSELRDLEASMRGHQTASPTRDDVNDSMGDFPYTHTSTLALHWRGGVVPLGNTILFRLAQRLANDRGDYVSVQRLSEHVWRGRKVSAGALKAAVSRLRQAIRGAGLTDVDIDGSQPRSYRMIVVPEEAFVTGK